MKEVNFNLKSIYGDPSCRSGHFGVFYRGVNYVKCPFDYVLYQMVLEEVKPDLIIEIGTHLGGGALYIADILERIGNGVIHTIDIVQKDYDPLIKNHPRIKTFFEGWQEYSLSNTEGYNKILIIDDGSHLYGEVKEAFYKFNSIVSAGSYYIIEDGVVYFIIDPDSFEGGPEKAIDEIISENQDFYIDRKWCDFFGTNATFNTNGYLKKLN
jgi:cephalosporin hydroxylase